jgi:hypothetical protein
MRELVPNPTKKWMVAALALHLAVALICLVFLVPQVDTNDDFNIHIMSSDFYGQATPYLGYTGILYSHLLVWLQQTVPALNWFTVLEYFFLTVSFCALGCISVCRSPNLLGFSFSAVLAFVFAPFFYNWLHYTKSAMLLGLSGFLLVFFALESQRIRKLPLAVGVLLALIGSAFRLQAFFVGAAFAFVIGLFTVLQLKGLGRLADWFKAYRKHLVTFALLFAAIAAFQIAKTAAYRSDGDAARFYEYCMTRATLSDYALPDYDTHFEAYQQLDVTRNDLELIQTWSFADFEYFPTEKLAAIIALRQPKTIGQVFRDFWADSPQQLFTHLLFIFGVAMLAVCLFFSNRGGKYMALALTGVFFACFIYQYAIGRTTRWVQAGMLGCFAASLIFCLVDNPMRRGKNSQRAVGLLLTFAACTAGVITYRGEWADYRTYFKPEGLGVYRQLDAQRDALFLADLDSVPDVDRFVPTFSAAPDTLMQNVYLLGGWDSGSAARNAVLNRFGVDGAPYRALVERDDVLLVDREHYLSKARFVVEHIDAATRYSLVDVRQNLYIFSFSAPIPAAAPHPDISLANVQSAPYADDLFFITFTLQAQSPFADALYYLNFTAENGQTMTYRTTLDGLSQGALTCIAPAFDFSAGAYQLALVAKTPDGLWQSAPYSLEIG